jgi:formamidopyrimidine-DNA glycosylase
VPELPEVETVRRELEPALAGARLTRVVARRPDLRFPLPDRFVQRLTGARVERLGRRGKFILAPLDTGETLAIHLGMTGRFEVQPAPRAPCPAAAPAPAEPRHAHILFETEAGALITFVDARRFGSMDLVETARLAAHPPFAEMGPEPLGPAFNAAHLKRTFEGRRQGPKTLLLDQRIVAGLGNIYVCEALHRAGVSPIRAASQISMRRVAGIVAAVRAVLQEAIAAGGSTLRDFARPDGARGYFQHKFLVYGRGGEPCPSPACPGVIRRLVQSGRSTFFCPVCQK